MLIPVDQWSHSMRGKGFSMARQASLLGLSGEKHLYNLVNDADRVKVDPETLEVWRRIRLKHKDDE